MTKPKTKKPKKRVFKSPETISSADMCTEAVNGSLQFKGLGVRYVRVRIIRESDYKRLVRLARKGASK